jgi:lysophospholipase L1-like esterase
MKFCYADFSPQTNVRDFFELYRRTIDSLRLARPQLVIVHCTVPLTARTPLWKRFIKWVLRREEFSDAGNVLRKDYNDLLLQQYGKDLIFDLAMFESTLPNGKRRTFEYEGKTAFALADEYTSDGGHLNQLGRQVVAKEFVRVLATAVTVKTQAASVERR